MLSTCHAELHEDWDAFVKAAEGDLKLVDLARELCGELAKNMHCSA